MTKQKFNPYLNRMDILEKGDPKSVEKLIGKIDEFKKSNFSFKLGNEIRQKSSKAIECILISLGKTDIKKAVSFLNIEVGNAKDLIDFIGERYKNNLTSFEFDSLSFNNDLEVKANENKVQKQTAATSEQVCKQTDDDICKELWQYRLYYNPNDDLVRKGDIIKKGEDYFLVLTPNCDLHRFWSKTLGMLNLVELWNCEDKKDEIIKLYCLTKKKSDLKERIGKTISSLSNSIKLSGDPLFLPYIPTIQKNLILFPKKIISWSIQMPDEVIGKESLKGRDIALIYDYLPATERITSLSEPFLTAVVEHIFATLKGYGTPDYPENLQNNFAELVRGVFKNEA